MSPELANKLSVESKFVVPRDKRHDMVHLNTLVNYVLTEMCKSDDIHIDVSVVKLK